MVVQCTRWIMSCTIQLTQGVVSCTKQHMLLLVLQDNTCCSEFYYITHVVVNFTIQHIFTVVALFSIPSYIINKFIIIKFYNLIKLLFYIQL